MKVPLVSIIIPLYNTEDYISQCLDSLINQSFASMEIIVVDDGSTDNSPIIVENYAKSDKRIRLIRQTNQGASIARNNAISRAQGEYISFVDCDDWMHIDGIEYLYKQAREFDAEIVAGNVLCYYDKDTIRPYRSFCQISSNPIQGNSYFNEAIRQNTYTMMVYNYLYKASYLREYNLKFEHITHEDELWTPQALILAKKIVVTDFFHYYYRQRKGSIMQKHQIVDKVNDIVYITNQLLLFGKNNLLLKNDSISFNYLLIRLFQLHNYIWSLDFNQVPKNLLESTNGLLQIISSVSSISPQYTYILQAQIKTKLEQN